MYLLFYLFIYYWFFLLIYLFVYLFIVLLIYLLSYVIIYLFITRWCRTVPVLDTEPSQVDRSSTVRLDALTTVLVVIIFVLVLTVSALACCLCRRCQSTHKRLHCESYISRPWGFCGFSPKSQQLTISKCKLDHCLQWNTRA